MIYISDVAISVDRSLAILLYADIIEILLSIVCRAQLSLYIKCIKMTLSWFES